MHASHAQSRLAYAEWLALRLDREAANRNTRRFEIRLPLDCLIQKALSIFYGLT